MAAKVGFQSALGWVVDSANFEFRTDVAGNIYIWSTITGSLLIKQRVHNSSAACNCVAWNPKMHSMLATAGDDRSVRM